MCVLPHNSEILGPAASDSGCCTGKKQYKLNHMPGLIKLYLCFEKLVTTSGNLQPLDVPPDNKTWHRQ